jgi:hypothetical protein
MEYELAHALKDAGFPQGNGFYVSESGRSGGGSSEEIEAMADMIGDKEGWAYIPTLKELIDACLPRFDSLTFFQQEEWRAIGGEHAIDEYGQSWEHVVFAPAPEIAIARLWLAMHSN